VSLRLIPRRSRRFEAPVAARLSTGSAGDRFLGRRALPALVEPEILSGIDPDLALEVAGESGSDTVDVVL
jgi:hypothetical protein